MATFPASRRLALAALSLLHFACAQNPGTTPDVHPPLTTYKCTTGGGCVAQDTSVVIDWGYHWIHTINGTESCTTSSGVNTTLCPNEATCAQNCVIEGANYTSSGVSTSGDSLTMYQYVQSNGATNNASPRLYLLGPDGNYEMLQLLGKEFRFDVDLSTLPCGENGALYLTQMDATGGRNPYNTGGANYGSGYCDAQCPVETWRNGTLNTNGAGYCCNEMDILEANSEANAFTPHPCYANGTNCDKSGCGFNPYAQGYHNYYGPNATDTVDTSKPFTIITQFLTSGGTSGTLTAIKRIYQQNGVTLPSAEAGGDEITESWCESSDSAAASFGGLTTMGEALGQGMVLAFSIWNDASAYMNWLDSGNNGPCSSTAGNPATIEANDPGTHVVFSNIRWGDINSTFTPGSGSSSGSGGSSGSSSISTSSSARSSSVTGGLSSTTSVASKVQSTSSTRPKKTATRKTHTQSHWGQCGGMKHKGPTACASPYSCKTQNPWYAQCL